MQPSISCLVLGAAALLSSSSAVSKQSCEEFSKGATFSPDQAVGTWYLLHLRPFNDPGDARCVQFSAVSDQERNNLKERVEKYISDIIWNNLVLKMQIPCLGKTGQNNKTRDYFLEKLDADGSYKTLQIPSLNAKLEASDFKGHAMRLKLVEGKYLAMIDCVEHFAFLLDKQPHEKALDPALAKLLQVYMPEEH